jgi:hypothetical protein
VLRAFLLRIGIGALPAITRSAIEPEGIEILEEGLWGSITFRNYRAPGRYSSWKRSGILGSIALTSRRIVAYGFAQRLLDIPYDHPTFAAVAFALEGQGRLCATFEASAFHADRSGTIEVRLRTPQAARIIELLRQRGARA